MLSSDDHEAVFMLIFEHYRREKLSDEDEIANSPTDKVGRAAPEYDAELPYGLEQCPGSVRFDIKALPVPLQHLLAAFISSRCPTDGPKM